jgi:hypothetical protein
MVLTLLDDTLKIEIFFEPSDRDFDDNISETCPDEEKIFIHDETNVYLTSSQAEQFASMLMQAAAASKSDRSERMG